MYRHHRTLPGTFPFLFPSLPFILFHRCPLSDVGTTRGRQSVRNDIVRHRTPVINYVLNWRYRIDGRREPSWSSVQGLIFFFFCTTGRSSVEACRWMSPEKIVFLVERVNGRKKARSIVASFDYSPSSKLPFKLPRKLSRKLCVYSTCGAYRRWFALVYTFVRYVCNDLRKSSTSRTAGQEGYRGCRWDHPSYGGNQPAHCRKWRHAWNID